MGTVLTSATGVSSTIDSVVDSSTRRFDHRREQRPSFKWLAPQDLMPELTEQPFSKPTLRRTTSSAEAWVTLATSDASSAGTAEDTISTQVADGTLLTSFVNEAGSRRTPISATALAASSYTYYSGYSSPTPTA